MKSALAELSSAWRLLSRSGKRILASYGLSLVLLSGLDAAALVLVSRMFVGELIDFQDDLPSLVAMVALFVARTILSTASSWWAVRAMAAEEARIGSENLGFLLNRDFALPLTETDYYNAVDRGPSSVTQGLLMYSVTIGSEAATTAVILATLLVLDFPTAVSSTVYFVLVALLQHRVLSRASAKAGDVVVRETNAVYEALNDGFKLRKVLRVMPSSSFREEVGARRSRLADARGRIAFLGTLPRYTMELVLSIGLVVVSGVAYMVNGESGTVKAIAIFGVAGFRLLPAINRIQGLILMLFSTVPAARLARLDTSSVSTTSSGTDLETEWTVEFRKVSFRYPSSDTDVIHDVSFALEHGLQYAIVGPSGAGKTTLLDLMLGVLQPSSGTVTRSSGTLVGYVPQDTHLARTGLKENVALEWDITRIDERHVTDALESAAIESLSQRFSAPDHPIMSDATASGGQRQRVGLARALYRSPSLLVLDEVTSALDAETESLVMGSIREMRGRTTVVIVAHRLTTVQHVDRVIYLDEGAVLGVGTFEELRRTIPQLQRQIELGTLDLVD